MQDMKNIRDTVRNAMHEKFVEMDKEPYRFGFVKRPSRPRTLLGRIRRWMENLCR